jgi:DNA-binding transcriptional ArsR family regulator
MSAKAAVRRRSSVRDREVGLVFRALADPTRRRIVERLAAGSASMTELARPFKMALPSFAQHMRVLETSNIVLSQKAGRVRRYALAPQALADAERWILDQREIWEQRLDRMQDYVEGLPTNKEKP